MEKSVSRGTSRDTEIRDVRKKRNEGRLIRGEIWGKSSELSGSVCKSGHCPITSAQRRGGGERDVEEKKVPRSKLRPSQGERQTVSHYKGIGRGRAPWAHKWGGAMKLVRSLLGGEGQAGPRPGPSFAEKGYPSYIEGRSDLSGEMQGREGLKRVLEGSVAKKGV